MAYGLLVEEDYTISAEWGTAVYVLLIGKVRGCGATSDRGLIKFFQVSESLRRLGRNVMVGHGFRLWNLVIQKFSSWLK
jgi:hypothetical protein